MFLGQLDILLTHTMKHNVPIYQENKLNSHRISWVCEWSSVSREGIDPVETIKPLASQQQNVNYIKISIIFPVFGPYYESTTTQVRSLFTSRLNETRVVRFHFINMTCQGMKNAGKNSLTGTTIFNLPPLSDQLQAPPSLSHSDHRRIFPRG